jgi:hypothetical protein
MASRRKFRPRTRSSGSRGLYKLVIIATEGTHTEKRYFEDMASQYYHNPRVHVEVLERLTNASSPNPEHRWPNSLGTRVYLLAETIIAQ